MNKIRLSGGVAVLFLALSCLAFFLFAPGGSVRCSYAGSSVAAGSCEPCPEYYCHDREVGRHWKEIKKARARAEGLPERYMTFWDRLDDCEACVKNSPDWVHIQYIYDAEGYQRANGHKPPYTSRSLPWSADLEKKIRDEMRQGVVKEFHIVHYGNKPCKCCRARTQKDYEKWFAEHDMDDADVPGYNTEEDFHPDAAISFTDKDKLGPDPADLTEMAEAFKRRGSITAPPVEDYMDPPPRFVHVMCDKCRKLADDYNRYARYIDDQRRRLAQARRALFFDRQAINDVWGEIEGVGKLAYTPATQKQMDKLDEELSQRMQQLDADKRKLEKMLADRKEWEDKMAALMKQILICEETACKTGAAPDDSKAALEKSGGNEAGALPDNKTKVVPDKTATAASAPVKGGACKSAPKAPAIAIGPNGTYGSGAQMKKKAMQTVGGALIGGLMGGGGGGGGFGGGSFGMVPGAMGSGKAASEGPKTVKNPVPKSAMAKMPASPAGTALNLGAAFTDKGLVVSSLIDKTAGNGTFHAVYLEDCQGRRQMPKDYLVFDLWRDWKLTVWWTHDRWVDGQHVLHESGGWEEKGSNQVGTFFFYRKGNETKGIWSLMGFETASSGVRGLGSVFDVTPGDLASGPLHLVVHTTLPQGETVMTDPQVFRLAPDGKGGVTVSGM